MMDDRIPEDTPSWQCLALTLAHTADDLVAREGLTLEDIIAGLGEFVASSFASIAFHEDATEEETSDFLTTFSEAMSTRTLELVRQKRDQEPPIP